MRTGRRGPAAAALGLVLAAALAGCGGGRDRPGGETLTVYAAASLTATFEDLAEEFERRHDGVGVELSFGGSADLATQLREGAEADVFASADTATMAALASEGLVGEPTSFATNTLRLAVPPGNPAGLRGLADLERDGTALVVCAPQVPCGAAALRVAEVAGVQLDPVSEEQSVTDVLAKVASGEADVGLVYVTDVLAAGADVEGIELPEARAAVNTYPIAPVAGTDDPGPAQDFVALVLGPTGRSVLREAGFGPP